MSRTYYKNFTQSLLNYCFVVIFPYAAHRGSQPINVSTLRYEIFICIIVNYMIYILLAKRFSSFYTEYFRYLPALIYMMIILVIGRIIGTYAAMLFNAQTHNMFRLTLIYDTLLTATLLISQIMIYQQSSYQNRLSMESKLRHDQFEQFENFKKSTDDIFLI